MPTVVSVLATYIYTLGFLIMAQYSAIVCKLTEEFTEAAKMLRKFTVFQILSQRNHFMDINKTLNKAYGPQILCRVFQAFFTSIGYGYRMLTDPTAFQVRGVSGRIGEIMIILLIVGEVFCYCGVCERARQQVSEFSILSSPPCSPPTSS